MGQEVSIRDAGALQGMKWLRGLRACQRLFSTSDSKAKAPEALVFTAKVVYQKKGVKSLLKKGVKSPFDIFKETVGHPSICLFS